MCKFPVLNVGPVHLRTLQLGIRLAATTHESSRQKFVCERMGRVSQRKSSFGRIHRCTPQQSTGSLSRHLHFRFSSSLLSPKRNITAKRTWSPIFLNQTTRTGPPSSLIPTSRIPGDSPAAPAAPGGSATTIPGLRVFSAAPGVPATFSPRPAVSPEILSSFPHRVSHLRERNPLRLVSYSTAARPIFCWTRAHRRENRLSL